MNITNECNMELMARYEDNHFDLAIVDPPYGILNKQTVISKTHENGTKTTNKKQSPILWDKAPSEDYFLELSRISENVVIFGANNFVNHLAPSSAWIVWDKLVSNKVHFASAELIYTNFSCSVKIVSMSPFDNLRGGKDRIHPTEKPVRLYEFILNNYAKEGDKILDTHLGSGSIAIACHNLGYDLTACELDKEYFESAMKRLNNHTSQLRII